jgi:hypothetical protein
MWMGRVAILTAAPVIPLDDALLPTGLLGNTVHEGCDRGGYYEQAQFAEECGSPLWIVKLDAGDQWFSATSGNGVGWAELAAVLTSAVSASPVRCPALPTNSCLF